MTSILNRRGSVPPLVIVLILLIGGAMLYFAFTASLPGQKSPAESPSEIVSQNVDTSNWETYWNEEWQIGFKYPAQRNGLSFYARESRGMTSSTFSLYLIGENPPPYSIDNPKGAVSFDLYTSPSKDLETEMEALKADDRAHENEITLSSFKNVPVGTIVGKQYYWENGKIGDKTYETMFQTRALFKFRLVLLKSSEEKTLYDQILSTFFFSKP